jgi:hypothetical protein
MDLDDEFLISWEIWRRGRLSLSVHVGDHHCFSEDSNPVEDFVPIEVFVAIGRQGTRSVSHS